MKNRISLLLLLWALALIGCDNKSGAQDPWLRSEGTRYYKEKLMTKKLSCRTISESKTLHHYYEVYVASEARESEEVSDGLFDIWKVDLKQGNMNLEFTQKTAISTEQNADGSLSYRVFQNTGGVYDELFHLMKVGKKFTYKSKYKLPGVKYDELLECRIK